ncbi:hypothetical protein HSACCH_01061 [Halanaerobium saccharolyticum subsp. saccharolyticum DSM 6643]|uniref:Uncharacterized protein n=1 Tax=Halanaerobium saccharolyticum subsp. saccharolyticum DSM 6643 TaxID=1293054 RepID=M5DZB2_9FIRM|nr:hypothetical protein HSACCH_01061 [Halanaerobium saccharolyticum subsp. saccharolyticum DSM 6643]
MIKNEEKGYGLPKIANIFKNKDVMNQTNKLIRLLSFQEKDNLIERVCKLNLSDDKKDMILGNNLQIILDN